MLLLGEVKQIEPARFGQKLLVKHLPDCPLMLNEELHRRLLRLFNNELTLWNAVEGAHLIVLGTFSAGPTGILSFQEMALMVVNQNWIPIENLYDQQLLSALSEARRRFVKGLRYNLPIHRPLASVVLSDTQPRPIAMYLIPPGANEEYEAEMAHLIQSSELTSWCWHMETEEMPAFPPRPGSATP